MLWNTTNVSSPAPPLIVIGALMPLERNPLVVWIVANSSSTETLASVSVRAELKSWPIWNVSRPPPPLIVTSAAVSSTAKWSSPRPPLMTMRSTPL